MSTFYTEVEVAVDVSEVLGEATIEELEEELKSREGEGDNYSYHGVNLENMYYKFVRGENIDQELRDLFFVKLGRLA